MSVNNVDNLSLFQIIGEASSLYLLVDLWTLSRRHCKVRIETRFWVLFEDCSAGSQKNDSTPTRLFRIPGSPGLELLSTPKNLTKLRIRAARCTRTSRQKRRRREFLDLVMLVLPRHPLCQGKAHPGSNTLALRISCSIYRDKGVKIFRNALQNIQLSHYWPR